MDKAILDGRIRSAARKTQSAARFVRAAAAQIDEAIEDLKHAITYSEIHDEKTMNNLVAFQRALDDFRGLVALADTEPPAYEQYLHFTGPSQLAEVQP